ncbi:MAG: DUF3820 family protein [Akkermansiaceae bacterium]
MADFTEMDREEFRELLNDIGNYHMPFGKFGPKDFPPKGVPLYDLPPEYLAWFAERGFPKGHLGELMQAVWGIKEVGMDSLFDPIRKARGGRVSIRKRRNKRGDSVDFSE